MYYTVVGFEHVAGAVIGTAQAVVIYCVLYKLRISVFSYSIYSRKKSVIIKKKTESPVLSSF